MISCKVSDLWSLLKKDKVTVLLVLKETQLSNPQKYKFGFFPGGGRKKLRIWVNSIHPGGWIWTLVDIMDNKRQCVWNRASLSGVRIVSIWVDCGADLPHKQLTTLCLMQTVAEKMLYPQKSWTNLNLLQCVATRHVNPWTKMLQESYFSTVIYIIKSSRFLKVKKWSLLLFIDKT